MVSAKVEVSGPKYGKGYWKVNNEVLTEYEFKEGLGEKKIKIGWK